MPPNCAAYGCNNRFGPETKEEGITFHLLPPVTDPKRKLWISNSRRIDPITRKPWNPSSKYIYFCSKHFMPSDFEPAGNTFGRRLKENAFPTVFTFPTVLPSSKERYHKLARNPNEDSSSMSSACFRDKSTHSRNPRHRKVVMLPKKIKLLQETSSSNMESVTIISFQHLNYDEKFQPMFQEAMLDLQYPEESEGIKCVRDDYNDPRHESDLEEEYADTLNKTETSEQEDLDENPEEPCSEENIPLKKRKYLPSTTGNDETTPNLSNTDPDHEHFESEDKSDKSGGGISKDSDVCVIEEKSSEELPTAIKETESSGAPSSPSTVDQDCTTILNKKVPLVIQELNEICDIEELRRKALRIAEDNVKLKRQVTYLKKKLEELNSEN